jgi:cob(I)alamin adenosyltransferase
MTSWFEFLRIEADLAMSFIDAARIHSNPTDSASSLGNARKALAEIQRGLMKPTARGLSEDEVSFLELRYTEIASALETF